MIVLRFRWNNRLKAQAFLMTQRETLLSRPLAASAIDDGVANMKFPTRSIATLEQLMSALGQKQTLAM